MPVARISASPIPVGTSAKLLPLCFMLYIYPLNVSHAPLLSLKIVQRFFSIDTATMGTIFGLLFLLLFLVCDSFASPGVHASKDHKATGHRNDGMTSTKSTSTSRRLFASKSSSLFIPSSSSTSTSTSTMVYYPLLHHLQNQPGDPLHLHRALCLLTQSLHLLL